MMSNRDDDESEAWRRFRKREDEAEAEAAQKNPNARAGSKTAIMGRAESREIISDTQEVSNLIERATNLIEQVHGLYQRYLAGAEKRPPVEKRKLLEQTMQIIEKSVKYIPCSTFFSILPNKL